MFCKIGFLKHLLNLQKYTCVGVSFIVRLQVNFGKIVSAIFLIEQLRTTASKNERFFSFKIYNIGNIEFYKTIFPNLKHKVAEATLISGNSFFLKKNAHFFWKK